MMVMDDDGLMTCLNSLVGCGLYCIVLYCMVRSFVPFRFVSFRSVPFRSKYNKLFLF
jgi:hypothetical protein